VYEPFDQLYISEQYIRRLTTIYTDFVFFSDNESEQRLLVRGGQSWMCSLITI